MHQEATMSPWRAPSRRGLRLLLALLLALGTTVAGSVTTQHAAQAATCVPAQESSGWHVGYGCGSERIPAAHHCMIVGISNDGSTEGVECADIYVTDTADATQIWGEGEYYCQGSHPQCLGMRVTVWVSVNAVAYIGSVPATSVEGTYSCTTSCPNGGQADVSTTHVGPNLVGRGTCYSVQSFEPADGATIFTSPINGYVASQILWINGATGASHAAAENDSANLTICLN